MMVIIMVTVILRYMVMKEEIQYYFLPIMMVVNDPDFSIAMHDGTNVKLIFLNSVFIFEFV